ncbi:MAG: flagellar basal body protein, partial [Candidatus Kurthia intestinigallinarum]
MAISTFMGLETNKRGLTAQQTALYTVGHNISNANTVGYTRQRVNLEATHGFPGVGMNAPMLAGHLGTGVTSQSITRVRNEFVDKQ